MTSKDFSDQKPAVEFPADCPFEDVEVVYGGHLLRYRKAANLDSLLDELAGLPNHHPAVCDERLPYWAEVWPSSLTMAEFILSAETLPDGDWLELGCGPGLAGVAAGVRGSDGDFSDYMQEAVDLALINWDMNVDRVGKGYSLDWRNPPSDRRYSWIIASDVAYEKRNFAPILVCFEQLLAGGGEIWLAEPGRPIATSFWTELRQAGWVREILEERNGLTINRLTRRLLPAD